MNSIYNKLSKEEALPLILREIYESRGYNKYKMGEFVPYDIYLENRNFLRDEGIITFTGANGKLMALKPDVTMSVVKNVADETVTKKVFYYENVFRMSNSQYEEINQIGVEFIGGEDLYASTEVIELACRSLEAISSKYILSINDMGFMAGLLEELKLNDEAELELSNIMKLKSLTALKKFCSKYELDDKQCNYLKDIIRLEGPFAEVLVDAKNLCLNEKMEIALDELDELFETLKAINLSDRIKLDLSIVNDLDYYNGIIFKGYIDGVPKAVLSGGRYDNLMHKLNKKQAAVGFALYLSYIDRLFKNETKYNSEAVIYYGNSNTVDVAIAVSKLSEIYKSVRAERYDLNHVKAEKEFNLVNGEIKEVKKNA
ncbi:MAG: ATP phosphoribosyltransferase regulatory subunit [Peptostreptococcaceae bacterium]|nr:ATP phosphoribosyltransferase regulatory subunit [Peptostreptococcaceae bacterium]